MFDLSSKVKARWKLLTPGMFWKVKSAVRGASAYDTNASPSAMAEPYHEVIGILEKPVLHGKHRPLSFMLRDAALSGYLVASFNKSRLVLEKGGCIRCAVKALTLMR